MRGRFFSGMICSKFYFHQTWNFVAFRIDGA